MVHGLILLLSLGSQGLRICGIFCHVAQIGLDHGDGHVAAGSHRSSGLLFGGLRDSDKPSGPSQVCKSMGSTRSEGKVPVVPLLAVLR